MGSYYPYVGFHFSVKMVNPMEIASALAGAVGLTTDIDGSFQEVSGLKAEMDVTPIREGGENRHEIHLPNGVKYSNLVVKRGLVGAPSALGTWVETVLNNDLMSNVMPPLINLPSHMLVMLLSKEGWPLMVWNVVNAIPVRWEVSGFDSMKNGYLIEEMEFSYQRFMRFNLDNMIGDLARMAAERVANSPLVKEPLNLAKTAVTGSKKIVRTAGEGAINTAADAVDDTAGKAVEETVGAANEELKETLDNTNKDLEEKLGSEEEKKEKNIPVADFGGSDSKTPDADSTEEEEMKVGNDVTSSVTDAVEENTEDESDSEEENEDGEEDTNT